MRLLGVIYKLPARRPSAEKRDEKRLSSLLPVAGFMDSLLILMGKDYEPAPNAFSSAGYF